MAGSDGAGVDVEEVLQALRSRVAERRAAGDYPEDLEIRMAEQFERVARFLPRPEQDLGEVLRAVEDLDSYSSFRADRIPATSASAAGERLHRAVAKAVSRQISGVLAQVQEYVDHERRVLELIAGRLGPTHNHADLAEQVDAALEASLLAARPSTRVDPAPPWFDALRWVERFEGPWDGAVERARELVRRSRASAEAASPALVLHAGRGEMVAALAEAEVAARGCEPVARLAAEARGRGLDVEEETATGAIATAGDGTLGLVAAVRGLERLGHEQLLGLAAGLSRALRPGGTALLAGTVPGSAAAGIGAGQDPGWRMAPDPAYLAFLLEEAGFSQADIESGHAAGTFVLLARR